ncbi:hypothetical protein Tco_1165067 [Tanacetum coccineum]
MHTTYGSGSKGSSTYGVRADDVCTNGDHSRDSYAILTNTKTMSSFCIEKKEAIHLILTGIGDEIYSTVDACKTAQEMWEAIKRLQQGESLNIQDVKTNLFWEFGQFTSHDGETIESYYTRFYKMMNEMIKNNLTVATMQVNVQFLQQLQLEWSRFVTIVKQQHKLDEVCISQRLFDILENNTRKLVECSRAKDHAFKEMLPNREEKQHTKLQKPKRALKTPVSSNDVACKQVEKVETGDSNVIPDSSDMCDNDIQDDQNDVECDDECVVLANLKLDVDENKKIQKQLKKANATLTQELIECKSILAETNRTLRESNILPDHRIHKDGDGDAFI